MPTVSVVVPTYNSCEFLAETLQSVFAQTRLPDELVAVDDASEDGTQELLRSMARRAPVPFRIICLSRNSGHPSRPMNVGIAAAKGDVIALLDHDDLILPLCLVEKLQALEQHAEVRQVYGDYDHFSDEEHSLGIDARKVGGDCHRLLRTSARSPWIVPAVRALRAFVGSSGLPCSCSNLCFRRELWSSVGGFDPKAGPCADYDFNLRCLRYPVAWIDTKLFRKRVHAANLWQPTARNHLQTWVSQWKALRGIDELTELQSQVVSRMLGFARRMRWDDRFGEALRAAIALLAVRQFRHGQVEFTKTLLALLRHRVDLRTPGTTRARDLRSTVSAGAGDPRRARAPGEDT